ncbi:carbonic anhydrase [Massilia niastensis]|uniref:carbonic anhydrase n=1 Tax=Massilia niastensis TaxID=544911 RepID=UPI00037BA807|nr:carbonic anhydrase [Massilia niastensis]
MSELSTSKRQFFKTLCACGTAVAAAAYSEMAYSAPGKKTTLTGQQALDLLKEGNAQFTADKPHPVIQGKERRLEIARGQTPIAVLVSCSDSRVPPELLFGRGLGELFIVRNAGNTVDTVAQGSIEYAVAELGVPLIVVMGHERCGAVDAAVSVVEKQTGFPGSIGQMVEPIIPAVLSARARLGNKKFTHDELLDASVRANVERVVNKLRGSQAMLLEPVRTKRLLVVGARYDLDDGRVEFFA